MSNRTTERNSGNDELLDELLKTGWPSQHIISHLKAAKMDEKEIDAFLEKYEESRHKLKKFIRKFYEKVERKYPFADKPELLKKGIKFAKKYELTRSEQEAFINLVKTGDTNKPYFALPDLGYTEMSKFFGLSYMPGQVFNIKTEDQGPLDEIAQLYEASKIKHDHVKLSLATYDESCKAQAIASPDMFRNDRHDVYNFIHPVIVSLFLPKISCLERRMLVSNIGRMVVQRASGYLRKYSNYTHNMTTSEYAADQSLMFDIARDPNSLNYFNDDTPISNLLKRFRVQIELYRTVMSLRRGQYYSQSESDGNDAISGLTNVLQSYEWTYFDSPEFHQAQDEGSLLRKLLAVFSIRPTWVQLSSFMGTNNLGFSNVGASRLSFISTPVINVRLPRTLTGTSGRQVLLKHQLSSVNWFIDNKIIVPKNQNVVYSRDLLFFNANRRYQSINFTNLDVHFGYTTVPGFINNVAQVNTTPIIFDTNMSVGNELFYLRSVVVVNKISKSEFALHGSAAIVIRPPGSTRTKNQYLFYNPIAANILIEKPNGYKANKPITVMQENGSADNPGFYETARKFGTIFVYSTKCDNI